MIQDFEDTIIAPATPMGVSALSVIRVSGKNAIELVSDCFTKDINQAPGYTIHYGNIVDDEKVVDEVLVSVFRAPKSYTGENSVEISGHGSPYITQRILQTLQKKGARMANPGEFTLRAFLNGKLDLAQAEAVADMIHSTNEAGLQMALQQMRGGFSQDIALLRQALIDFAALIELENDFGEEDVEFANRDKLRDLVTQLLKKIYVLRDSFTQGNALKNGIHTVIAGKPNAGKSTLLNALLNDERAIVSSTAGTTRDTIEELFSLNGIQFRLIDTAGLRQSDDPIEQLGVQKTLQSLQNAGLLLYVFDIKEAIPESVLQEIEALPRAKEIILVANKIDEAEVNQAIWPTNTIFISAIDKNIQPLLDSLSMIANSLAHSNEQLVNNARHEAALTNAALALERVLTGLDTFLSSDLVALDIRDALYHLGVITGQVTNDEVLSSIFSRFCIGK